jgi:hypothetical protein
MKQLSIPVIVTPAAAAPAAAPGAKPKREPPRRCDHCNRFMSLFAGALYFCSRCEGIELPRAAWERCR